MFSSFFSASQFRRGTTSSIPHVEDSTVISGRIKLTCRGTGWMLVTHSPNPKVSLAHSYKHCIDIAATHVHDATTKELHGPP